MTYVYGSGSHSEEQGPSGGGQLPVDGVALFGMTRRYGAMYYGLESIFLVGTSRSRDPGGCEKLIGTCGAVHPCRVKTFSKSHVHGYGRLGESSVIIDNMNESLKLVDNE